MEIKKDHNLFKSQVNNKRIAKNTLFLYFRMILLMMVSLYTSRVVLDKLGVEDYGIYNIVGGVIFLFSFISGPMIESTQRYLNFYMGKKDLIGLRQVFNASQIIHLCVALFIFLLAESIGLWFFHNKLIIPEVRFSAALFTYHVSMIATIFSVLSYPYNAVIIAREKMSVFAAISIFEALVKLLLVYLLTISPCDKLKFYAFLMMLVHVCIAIIYRIYCYKHFEEVTFNINDIPRNLYKQILSFSGWNFLGNLANVCLLQGTNILLNIFFGPAVNAAKGISAQVQNAVNQLCNSFQMALRPQIVKSYAAGQIEEMHDLIFRASRFSYFLVLLLAIPVYFKTEWILAIWLKEVPEYASDFVQYSIMFVLIQSLANPLLTGCVATGNVKKIMSVIASFFVTIIPICYIFLRFDANPIIVFQIQLVMYLIAHIIRIKIVSKQIGFSIQGYIKQVLTPIIGVSCVSFISSIIINKYIIGSFIYNFSAMIVSAVAILCSIISLGITKNERIGVMNIIKSKIYGKSFNA